MARSTGTTENGRGEESIEDIPLNVVFDVLKNRRRRIILEYFADGEGPVDLGVLSETVASIENEKSRTELESMERKKAYVGLYQCHLPRLDDAGAINFDKTQGMVERGPAFEQYVSHLEPDERAPFVRISLAASVVGVVLGLLVGGVIEQLLAASIVMAAALVVVAIVSFVDLRDVL